MRYRIVKEVNGNDEAFYEVHFYKQVPFVFFFKKWKWEPVTEYKRQGDYFTLTRTARYDTLKDAQNVVNKYSTKRTLESMGEIESDDAYTP